jgi:hypothetical protein
MGAVAVSHSQTSQTVRCADETTFLPLSFWPGAERIFTPLSQPGGSLTPQTPNSHQALRRSGRTVLGNERV